jgi:predicted nucleic acid-binding protein
VRVGAIERIAMLVVDTNIIFPLFVQSTRSEDVWELKRRDGLWRTEPFALIELSNILSLYKRKNLLTGSVATTYLEYAEQVLRPDFFYVPNAAALEIAMKYEITAYDARFLAVAVQLGVRLVTEDKRLRTAAPHLTQSLDEALEAMA